MHTTASHSRPYLLRKAAEIRLEASRMEDPRIVERMRRIAERWEERAETVDGEYR